MSVSPSRARLIAVLEKKAARRKELLEAIENGITRCRIRNCPRVPLLWEERANAKEHLTNIARW